MSEPDIAEVIRTLHQLQSSTLFSETVADAITLLRKLERMQHVATVLKTVECRGDGGGIFEVPSKTIDTRLKSGTKLYATGGQR